MSKNLRRSLALLAALLLSICLLPASAAAEEETPIKEVVLDGVVPPETDADMSFSVTLPADAAYELLNDVAWVETGSVPENLSALNNGDWGATFFQAGNHYSVYIMLYAKPGFVFTEDTVATINGKQANLELDEDDPAAGDVWLHFGQGSKEKQGQQKTYAMKEGEEKTVSAAEEAVFVSEADFMKFVGVQIDGETIQYLRDYTIKEGSTIVTLNIDYLRTLSLGPHTIAIISEDGIATAEFDVVEAKEKDIDDPGDVEPPSDPEEPTTPDTTDPEEPEDSGTAADPEVETGPEIPDPDAQRNSDSVNAETPETQVNTTQQSALETPEEESIAETNISILSEDAASTESEEEARPAAKGEKVAPTGEPTCLASWILLLCAACCMAVLAKRIAAKS